MAANKDILTTDGQRNLVCGGGSVVRTVVSGKPSKNLICVAEFCNAGFDVQLSNTKGHRAVHAATGASVPFARVGKVFDVKFKVRREPAFTRQGNRHP